MGYLIRIKLLAAPQPKSRDNVQGFISVCRHVSVIVAFADVRLVLALPLLF